MLKVTVAECKDERSGKLKIIIALEDGTGNYLSLHPKTHEMCNIIIYAMAQSKDIQDYDDVRPKGKRIRVKL